MKRYRLALIALLGLLAPSFAVAHGQSTSLLRVSVQKDATPQGRVQLDLAIVDLEQAIGVDRDGDGTVTWGELRASSGAIEQYVTQRLTVSASSGGSPCALSNPQLLVDEHADGPYAVLVFATDCIKAGDTVTVDYRLFFDQNAQHRALASFLVDGNSQSSDVLSSTSPRITWSAERPGFFSGFTSWIGEGIWHIWTGLDHLLFLATLLLAADRLSQVVKIVSAFTLSHSLTLIGGALGWIHFQSRWVEAAIALTVLIGAINLVIPLARRRLWLLALGFGLVHGLGFASVLAGMQLDNAHLIRDLLGFNLGVEIGQLTLVFLLVPLIRALHEKHWYRHRFTPGAATAIAALAAVWLFQRLS